MKNKMMKKIFFLSIMLIAIIGVSVGFNKVGKKIISFQGIEALAAGEAGGSGGVDYSKGYMNKEEDCKISETAHCDISIYVPYYGYCSVGFDYTVKHDGKQNYCDYTGGPSGCSFHKCERNK